MNVVLKSRWKKNEFVVINWDNVTHAEEFKEEHNGESYVEVNLTNGRTIYVNHTLEELGKEIKDAR